MSIGADTPTHWIGQGDVVVPDVLDDKMRDLLGPHASWADDAATYRGLSYARQSEAELRELRAEAEASLTSPLDVLEARESASWHDLIANAEAEFRRASEDVLVLEGKAHSAIGTPVGHTADLAEAQERSAEARQDWADAVEQYHDADRVHDDLGNVLEEHLQDTRATQEYVAEWLGANDEPFYHLIAIDRRLAVLQAEQRPESERARMPEGASYKDIGSDAPVLLAERRMQESDMNADLGRSVPWISLGPEDVPEPPALDASYDAFSARHRADVVGQLKDLNLSLYRETDEVVRARSKELSGQPAVKLDGAAARKVARLENMIAIVTGDRDSANAKAQTVTNRDWAAQEANIAAGAQAKLDRYEKELAEMHRDRTHPDEQIVDVDHRRQAWRREAELRTANDMAFGVKRSLDNPSKELVDRIGAEPVDGTAAQRAKWRELGTRIETDRLTEAAARIDGVEPPARDLQAEHGLNRDVDAYRSEMGMAAPGGQGQKALVRDGGGYGMG